MDGSVSRATDRIRSQPVAAHTNGCPLGRVLVVEDEPSIAHNLAGIVAECRGAATVAATACAARERLAKFIGWTALILDEGLPDGSGIQLLREVRALRRSTPALLLTGRCEPELANQAFEAGAQFLRKPATKEQIEQFLFGLGRQEHAVPEDLPDDIQTVVYEVLRAAEILSESRADYASALAALARTVSQSASHAQCTTEALAHAAEVSRSELQRFKLLTTQFSPDEIGRLLRRRDVHGHRLTLHDLITVASAPAPLRQDLKRILRAGGDAGDLQAVLRDSSEERPT